MSSAPLFIQAAGPLLALICLIFALRAARRKRLIDNVPTCKTTGVFIGLVELKGTAETGQPLVSYLAQAPCVYYTWSIAEHWSRTVTETYRDSQSHTRTRTRHESGWTTVGEGGEQMPFYLRDDQGVIRVIPDGASIEPLSIFDEACGRSDPLYYDKGPAHSVSNSDHRRHFQEQAIPLHAPLYVMGHARERTDVVAPEIAQHCDAPLFLISTRSEAQVSGSFGLHHGLLGALGLLLCVGSWIASDAMANSRSQTLHFARAGEWAVVESHASNDLAARLPRYVALAAGFVAAWLLGWTWMAYNSLVDLRQRVRQAWANVDVQLKRRADLIPNLVRTVEGLRDHERQLQTEVAHFRSQLAATPPGEPGPDPRACSGLLTAVVERYPELKADAAFGQLQQQLVDTEQRIALARGYFNEIAAFYNARLEIVPDRYVAALAALRPRPLMGADQFERAAVAVRFAD